MTRKFSEILKYCFSYFISAGTYVCYYFTSKLNLKNHISLLEEKIHDIQIQLQSTQERLQSTQEQLQKEIRQLFCSLLASHIKPDGLNMYDLEKCEVSFLWDSSRLYGLKYLFGEITFLLFLPRNPRINKFIGYERVPQDTEVVIIRFIKNDIDNIWIQRGKEIINLADDKLQTKDIQSKTQVYY